MPVVAGRVSRLYSEVAATSPRPFMHLTYHLHQSGGLAQNYLYCDDAPEQVAALYDEVYAWMRETS